MADSFRGQFLREANDVMDLHLVRHEESTALGVAMLSGDEDAIYLGRIIRDWFKSVRRHPKNMCLLCDDLVNHKQKHRPSAFFVAVPHNDDATVAMAFALCQRCGGGTREELMARAVAKLKGDMPSLRVLPPFAASTESRQ